MSVCCNLVVTCWGRAGLGSLEFDGDNSCVFVTFPIHCSGSGVVPECIDS